MKHRKLRIAWSVAWGVVAVLSCVLWVRSYWWFDWVSGAIVRGPSGVAVQSASGKLRVLIFHESSEPLWWEWTTRRIEGHVVAITDVMNESKTFDNSIPGAFVVTVSQWLTSFAVTLLAALPWLRFRYSLRTANRHDARCRGVGYDRVDVASGVRRDF
jgi:hypothetical protein